MVNRTSNPDKTPHAADRADPGTGLAIGVALGLTFGTMFGNPGMGIAIGAALGLVFGDAFARRGHRDLEVRHGPR